MQINSKPTESCNPLIHLTMRLSCIAWYDFESGIFGTVVGLRFHNAWAALITLPKVGVAKTVFLANGGFA